MNLSEVLQRSGEIKSFPKIKTLKQNRYSKESEGVISGIHEKGIEVKFSDLNYNVWYWFEDVNDGRKHYTKDLILI